MRILVTIHEVHLMLKTRVLVGGSQLSDLAVTPLKG
jgi:hypothetical protein